MFTILFENSPQDITHFSFCVLQDEPTEFRYPRLTIEYKGTHGPIAESIESAPEEWRLTERSLPRSISSVWLLTTLYLFLVCVYAFSYSFWCIEASPGGCSSAATSD